MRYGIASAPAPRANAAQILTGIRRHWQIKNGLHYRRDVTLKEDASLARIEQAPHVLATVNNVICGLTAQAGIINLAACQRSMAATFDRWFLRL